METLSIIASAMSLLVGFLAIWLSIHFYNQSKNTEREVSKALEGIKAQSDVLQQISSSHMSQLIQGLIAPRSTEQSLIYTITEVMRIFPMAITSQMSVPTASTENLREIIDCYIAIYFWLFANFEANV